MAYEDMERRLQSGGIAILDGGTGTELERRGVPMDPEAWCGAVALDNAEALKDIHLDYIAAGADIITANTYSSSRLMLEPAGFGDKLDEINRRAVAAAHQARHEAGREGILIAGSISHRSPSVPGTARSDPSRAPSESEMVDAFVELAELLRAEGCDLILLEMMYDPARMNFAFDAARDTGLPVWAGFSARRGADGAVLSFFPDRDIPFADVVAILEHYEVAAAGIMHTPSNVIGDTLDILSRQFKGPMLAYPDSGYFKSPRWQFEEIIPPADFRQFADDWVAQGARIIGGCCGLSPEHIAALGPLKAA